MCSILIQVVLSALAGLVWCMMVMAFCLGVELILRKRKPQPRLSMKETILIKEVLAGHVSLPVVANDGVFTKGVEKLEALAAGFTDTVERQINRLERVSENLAPYSELVERIDEDLSRKVRFRNILEEDRGEFKIEEEPGFSIEPGFPVLQEEHLRQLTLASSLSEIKLPGIGRNILDRKFGCRSVHDALLVMLKHGNRDALMEIPLFGLESVHALEIFMIQEGLMKVDKIDGDYLSDYWEKEKYDELQKRAPRI